MDENKIKLTIISLVQKQVKQAMVNLVEEEKSLAILLNKKEELSFDDEFNNELDKQTDALKHAKVLYNAWQEIAEYTVEKFVTNNY